MSSSNAGTPSAPAQSGTTPFSLPSTTPLASTSSTTNSASKQVTTDEQAKSSTTMNGQPVLPRDARYIALLLAANGCSDAEQGVIRMLIEFAHRYTSDILTDSLLYAEHSKSGINSNPSNATINLIPTVQDLKLAVQSRQEATSVPKEFLLQLATQINSNPLPPIPEVYGIRLPAQKDRLTAPNFTIRPRDKDGAIKLSDEVLNSGSGVNVAQRGEEDEEEDADGLFGSDDDDEDEDDEDEDEDEDEEMEEVTGRNDAGVNGSGKRDRDEDEDDDDDDDDEE